MNLQQKYQKKSCTSRIFHQQNISPPPSSIHSIHSFIHLIMYTQVPLNEDAVDINLSSRRYPTRSRRANRCCLILAALQCTVLILAIFALFTVMSNAQTSSLMHIRPTQGLSNLLHRVEQLEDGVHKQVSGAASASVANLGDKVVSFQNWSPFRWFSWGSKHPTPSPYVSQSKLPSQSVSVSPSAVVTPSAQPSRTSATSISSIPNTHFRGESTHSDSNPGRDDSKTQTKPVSCMRFSDGSEVCKYQRLCYDTHTSNFVLPDGQEQAQFLYMGFSIDWR
jgi:hypothetical protein